MQAVEERTSRTPRSREELARRTLIVILVAAVAALLLIGLERASAAVFAGNSDGATVVLEGVSIAHGHLTLFGWDLSDDSFWTVDALFYAVVTGIFGLHADVLHVVPALIALCAIAVGSLAAIDRRRGLGALAGGLVLVGLIGLPSPILSYFLLQGPWHVGTTLWCLVAFVGLRKGRFGLGFALAVVVLAAGLLGDLLTVPLGLVPCVLGGLSRSFRRRKLWEGLPAVVAPIAAGALALIVRFIVSNIGAYQFIKGNTKAKSTEYPHNVHLILTWFSALFGVGYVPIGPSSSIGATVQHGPSSIVEVLHVFGLVLVVASVLVALISLISGVVRGSSEEQARASLVEDMLLFALAGGLLTFIYLCPNGNGNYARYLVPSVLFAAVLTARTVTNAIARPVSVRIRALGLAAVALFSVLAVIPFDMSLHKGDAPQEATALGDFLVAHHLDVGIGDYWSSSIVTVITNGTVEVRPVIKNPHDQLQRYGRQSDASWYAGTNFEFLVYDTARPWRDVNSVTATNSFGPPARTYAVGTYRVLVWSKDVQVSSIGFSNH